jgi:hypothetical protein
MASLFMCERRAGWQASQHLSIGAVRRARAGHGSFLAKDARHVEDENFRRNIFILRQL